VELGCCRLCPSGTFQPWPGADAVSWCLPCEAGGKTRDVPNSQMAVGQNLVPLVNIKIAGKWMFIPLKMVLIDIDS